MDHKTSKKMFLSDLSEIATNINFQDKENVCMYQKYTGEKNLYHYTNINGLQGIIETGCLWATNIDFLNDKQEQTFAKEHTKKIVKESINTNKYNAKFNKMLSLSLDYINPNTDNRYVICFSKKYDELTMWSIYAKKFGICIEFSLDNPSYSFFDIPFFAFHDVVYGRESLEQDIRKFIEVVYKKFLEYPNLIVDDEILSFLSASYCVFYEKYKDDSYRYEQETRLIHYDLREKRNNIRFRTKNGFIVPYIEYKPMHSYGQQCALPIKSITLSPFNKEDDLNIMIKGINLFMKNNGYLNVEIRKSNIKCRDI